jgi:HTH-type transcriptional regulator, transcriptional repressor of NAD biosynthesis genes
MKRGLVFGKFMPLHRGHQLLIERALAEVDDLTIVVWDSVPPGDYPPMPLELRLRWLRTLYPDTEAIVGLPDTVPFPQSDDPAFAAHYAGELGFLGRFHAVFTSEPHYQEFADILGARHVVVDEARELVPISGTRIREDLYEHRAWVDPRVYATLVQKVAIVGTESSGKSTLARALAERNDTLWVHEYGRELWEAQGLTGTFVQHLEIARRQHRREEAARRHARRFLFCDTNAWTTLHWSLWAYGTADARLRALVDETIHEYVWVVCADDFGWVQDGTREMGDGKAAVFQRQQIADLERRGVDYLYVGGSVEERAAAVEEALGVPPVAGSTPRSRRPARRP